MPNITQYENQVEGPHPTDLGSSAYAMMGRRVGQFYHQIGEDVGGTIAKLGDQYVQHETRVELMQQGADIADYHAKALAAQQEIVDKTPPDQVEAKMAAFHDQVNSDLDKLGEKYSTDGARDTFIKVRAGLSDELFTRGAGLVSKSVADGSIDNLDNMTHSMSNIAFNNPTQFEDQVGLLHTYMMGLVHTPEGKAGLPLDQALTLERDAQKRLAISAGQGAARANPDQFMKDYQAGSDHDPLNLMKYLDAGDIDKLRRDASEYSHAAETEANRAQEDAIKQQKLAFTQKANDIISRMTDPNTGDFNYNPGFMKEAVDAVKSYKLDTSGDGKAFLEFMHHAASDPGQKQRSDPATYDSFRKRIDDQTNPLSESDIKGGFSHGLLSYKDYTDLHNLIKPDADPAARQERTDLNHFLEQMKPAITQSSNPMYSQFGVWATRQNYNFQIDATNYFKQARAAGVSADDLLRNVKSPYYLGKLVPKFIASGDRINDIVGATTPKAQERYLTQPTDQFTPQGGGQQAAAPAPAAVLPGVAARKPGESAEQYLARIHNGGQ